MRNRLVYGIGIYNKGEHRAKIDGKKTKVYQTWQDMLRRCHDPKHQTKHPTYIGCSVCDEWLDFQNFATWYDKNYYEILLLGVMQLDKDILIKGNKIYSPDTCVLVPRKINNLFTKRDAKRGKYPIGVYYHKPTKKYLAQISYGDGIRHYLGLFDTAEEAFEAYKIAKEIHIKDVAETYYSKLNLIPSKLYEAMMNYEVNIDD
jgi:hypothetical protein